MKIMQIGDVWSAIAISMSAPALATETKTMNTFSSEQATEQKAAELVVMNYMKFLREGSTDEIMNLYDKDAVFLPAEGPTLVGKDQIREGYVTKFKIMDIPESSSTLEEATIHGDIAVVRLATKSTILLLSNQQKIPMNARELFILNKTDGKFKISRYMFNTIK